MPVSNIISSNFQSPYDLFCHEKNHKGSHDLKLIDRLALDRASKIEMNMKQVKWMSLDLNETSIKMENSFADIFNDGSITTSSITGICFIDSILNFFKDLLCWLLCIATEEMISLEVNEIIEEFRELINALPVQMQQKLYQRLNKISEAEVEIMRFIKASIETTASSTEEKVALLSEILSGAYVMIEDGGKVYDEWVNQIDNKTRRPSSHKSNGKQYAVRGNVISEFLFSKKIRDVPNASRENSPSFSKKTEQHEVTWFQMERYPVNFGCCLLHLWSWIIYKLTGRNQGPFGTSMHSEKSDPIILKFPPNFFNHGRKIIDNVSFIV